MSFETSPGSNVGQLPADKVAVGYIVTNTLLEMMRCAARKDDESYRNLIVFLDSLIVQYKDKKYDAEIAGEKAKFGTVPIDSVFRIVMRLMQRCNFMPVKTYDGQLIVDMEAEENVDVKEQKNDPWEAKDDANSDV